MPADDLDFLSREELLGGGMAPGRRASSLLFALESRTAHLVARSQQAVALFLTKGAVEEREEAFFDALASGRDLPLQPTIQDIERYAAHWSDLVSEADVSLRAALARALGRKYTFTYGAVPEIRATLGLDGASIQQEFQRLYGEPLSSVYAPEISYRDRLSWALSGLGSRLEGLPPFWVAFALTLPVGPGLLALPIAVAGVGVLPGIVLLIFFGMLNAITAAALAESVARSGVTRFGLGYVGQLVSEYLGDAGSVLLTSMLALNNFLVLIVFYLGIADTLESATRLPAELWIAGAFVIGLYFLSRRSLNSTVASALVVVAINVTLLLVIPLFALPYLNPANLTSVRLPWTTGQPFDSSVLLLIFGVMLANFFSHLLVANYGQVILEREPSGRSWIWGCMAAIGATTLISCLWVITFNGAIPPQILAQETGTALTALTGLVGPVVNWLGSIFVILSLGMASIHVSLGLLFLVEERLPAPSDGRLGGRGRFLLTISPVIVVFLLAEWLSITGQGSFAGILSFVGVVALPLLAGIFPVLLLAATRRKGDFVPGLVLRFLGNPIVLGMTYLVFLGSIFVYGLFIYEGTVQRAITLAVGIVILVVTVIMLRRGALDRRVVVELREDLTPEGKSVTNAVDSGQAAVAEVRLAYRSGEQYLQAASSPVSDFAELRSAVFHMPATQANKLKVWAHRLTPEETSEALPATLRTDCETEGQEYDLKQSGGQVLLPLEGQPYCVEINLLEQAGEGEGYVKDTLLDSVRGMRRG